MKLRSNQTVVGLFFTICVLLIILSACAKPEKTELSLKNLEPMEKEVCSAQDQTPLRLGLSTGILPETNLHYYEPLADYLSEKLGQPVKIVQRNTYGEINELMSFDQIDVAIVCSSSYILSANMELLAVPQIQSSTTYESLIITQADRPITSFNQLRGKTFAFTDPISTTGTVYPLSRIYALGEKPETFFKTYFYTYNHEKSINAVAEKLVDGASVDSTVWSNVIKNSPDLSKKLKIIEKSPPFPNSPVVARKDLAAATKEKIKQVFLDMANQQEGQQVLALYGLDNYVVGKPEDYRQVERLMKQVIQKWR